MVTPERRNFSILGLMVLIGGLAIGLALTREGMDLHMISDGLSVYFRAADGHMMIRGAKNSWVVFPGMQPSRWSHRLQNPIFRVTPCLTVLTMAVLLLSFRHPRPPLHRLFRRPGTVAGMAVGLALVAAALQYPMLVTQTGGVQLGMTPSVVWKIWRTKVWFFLPRQAGFAVGTAWLTQWLSGCFHPNQGWVDRLGRVLGACWIALAVIGIVASVLFGFAN